MRWLVFFCQIWKKNDDSLIVVTRQYTPSVPKICKNVISLFAMAIQYISSSCIHVQSRLRSVLLPAPCISDDDRSMTCCVQSLASNLARTVNKCLMKMHFSSASHISMIDHLVFGNCESVSQSIHFWCSWFDVWIRKKIEISVWIGAAFAFHSWCCCCIHHTSLSQLHTMRASVHHAVLYSGCYRCCITQQSLPLQALNTCTQAVLYIGCFRCCIHTQRSLPLQVFSTCSQFCIAVVTAAVSFAYLLLRLQVFTAVANSFV